MTLWRSAAGAAVLLAAGCGDEPSKGTDDARGGVAPGCDNYVCACFEAASGKACDESAIPSACTEQFDVVANPARAKGCDAKLAAWSACLEQPRSCPEDGSIALPTAIPPAYCEAEFYAVNDCASECTGARTIGAQPGDAIQCVLTCGDAELTCIGTEGSAIECNCTRGPAGGFQWTGEAATCGQIYPNLVRSICG